MLATRIAARIGTGHVALAVFGCLVTGVQTEPDTPVIVERTAVIERVEPAEPPSRACSGWIPSSQPPLYFVDIERVAADDAWLLATHGLFHWDGCAWRAHAPFAEIPDHGIFWFDIAVDDGGFIWLQGRTPELQSTGPRGWCGYDPGPIPARAYAYVLEGTKPDGSLPKWRQMDPKLAPPRRAGSFDVTALGRARKIVATSGAAGDQWAIVELGTVREVWRSAGSWWIPIHIPASNGWQR